MDTLLLSAATAACTAALLAVAMARHYGRLSRRGACALGLALALVASGLIIASAHAMLERDTSQSEIDRRIAELRGRQEALQLRIDAVRRGGHAAGHLGRSGEIMRPEDIAGEIEHERRSIAVDLAALRAQFERLRR